MAQWTNEQARYGRAEFATAFEIAEAGLFVQKPNSLFVGFMGGRRLWYHGPGGVLLVAGARAGKLRDMLAYNVCSGVLGGSSLLVLDPKAEQYWISQNQVPDNKFVAAWAPHGAKGLPHHKVNPCDYLSTDSPSLVSDLTVFCENMVPLSGSPNSSFFELRAREFLLAICHTLVLKNGVLRLNDLYEIINTIPGGGDDWVDFACLMNQSTGFTLSQRIEEEIHASREDSAGGTRGVLSELFKSVACLADPKLLDSVSPPYDFSMADLCRTDRYWQIYLCPPAEFIEAWAPVLRAMFVGAMIYKARAPEAPGQTWIIDEGGQLGKFPLVVKMFTWGAGIGIRPVLVLQSAFQMREIGPHAEHIIASSAAAQIYYTIRDFETAQRVSKLLGSQTLEYDNPLQQGAAAMSRRELALQSMFGTADPFTWAPRFDHLEYAEAHRSKQRRDLRTPAELINAPPNAGFLLCDDLQSPVMFERRPYFDQRDMAGRFHPNPYHPPLDRVRVKERIGHAWRFVRTGPVPPGFADSPIYADGTWSWIARC